MVKRWLLPLLLACLWPTALRAQSALDQQARAEMDFALRLAANDWREEALQALAALPADALEPRLADSLRHLRAQIHFREADFAAAWDDWSRVGPTAPFAFEARAYGAFALLMDGRIDLADSALSACPTPDSLAAELLAVLRAGHALLARDPDGFARQAERFGLRHHALARPERELLLLAQAAADFRPRSPMLAAGLSALVPGLGKIYAGRLGEGLSAALTVSALGLMALENHRKAGPWNWKTLGFGGAFAVFHLGNVLGSFHLPDARHEDFWHEQDDATLGELHHALRLFFP